MTASPAISNYENPVTDLSGLTPAHVAFADFVAAGQSYQQAAENAGFAKPTGFKLAKVPAIQKRIASLISNPDRAMLMAGYTLAVIRTENAVGDSEPGTEKWRANLTLHLTALDKLARFNGWLVDRRQTAHITARLNVQRGDLDAAIRADVERLAPGALRQLESGVTDLQSLASGDTPQPVVVDSVTQSEHKAKVTVTPTESSK